MSWKPVKFRPDKRKKTLLKLNSCTFNGRRFAAGSCHVQFGGQDRPCIAMIAGRKRRILPPEDAVAWLVREGCNEGLARSLTLETPPFKPGYILIKNIEYKAPCGCNLDFGKDGLLRMIHCKLHAQVDELVKVVKILSNEDHGEFDAATKDATMLYNDCFVTIGDVRRARRVLEAAGIGWRKT